MTYEVIILGHLHMPLYFIGTFTEYSYLKMVQESLKKPWFQNYWEYETIDRPVKMGIMIDVVTSLAGHILAVS